MRRLIGWDVQLAELIDALNEGRGALIWGSAGVGKTALAAAVAGHMVEHGDHVDWIVATAASRAIPFGALAPLLVDDLDADLPPTLVLAAISRRLRAMHRRRGPLLVVDDAHLLDDASAATLLGLVSTSPGWRPRA